jgi:hypothetical protein
MLTYRGVLHTCFLAKRVLINARRVAGRPVRRLRRMLADLAHVIDAVEQIIAQTRRVSLHDSDARPIRNGSLATPTSSVTPARSPTTATASLSATRSRRASPPTPHSSRPVAATTLDDPDLIFLTGDHRLLDAALTLMHVASTIP